MIEIHPERIKSCETSMRDINNILKNGVTKVSARITYDDFFKNFMNVNIPCLIESGFTDNWKSRQEWVDNTGRPNFSFLAENFGKMKVPIADCKEQYYNSQKKSEDKLENYLNYWKSFIKNEYNSNEPCLYLKDWHFTRDFPNYKAYTWPQLFSSDWLNEYWKINKNDDDYRFVYMGPKGTWTPLHVDVLTSYSWSTNICGIKKWLLFPPGYQEILSSKYKQLPYDINLFTDNKYAVEVMQQTGETIFVPSGWYHQVWNLDDTISINHNWLNGCCILNTWNGLKKSFEDVKNELSDCKDMFEWDKQCQIVLAATTGTNLHDFIQLLTTIAHVRIKCLNGEPVYASSTECILGKHHAKFDLLKILEILPDVIQVSNCDDAKILIADIKKARIFHLKLHYFYKILKTLLQLRSDIL